MLQHCRLRVCPYKIQIRNYILHLFTEKVKRIIIKNVVFWWKLRKSSWHFIKNEVKYKWTEKSRVRLARPKRQRFKEFQLFQIDSARRKSNRFSAVTTLRKRPSVRRGVRAAVFHETMLGGTANIQLTQRSVSSAIRFGKPSGDVQAHRADWVNLLIRRYFKQTAQRGCITKARSDRDTALFIASA